MTTDRVLYMKKQSESATKKNKKKITKEKAFYSVIVVFPQFTQEDIIRCGAAACSD